MQKRGLFFRIAEGWLRVENLLFTFWFLFWTLNGLDKFFNGVPKQDPTWGKYNQGWFGVNRDEKFIHYFDRLHLPDTLALGVLYTFAVLEIILGLAFIALLFTRTPKVIHRTCFKMSLILFICFMTGDILFGDRMELWEHGTFMVLVIITFQLYLDRAHIRQEVLAELGVTGPSPQPTGLMNIPGTGGGNPNRPAAITQEFNMLLQKATSDEEPTGEVHIEQRKPQNESNDDS